MYTTLGFFTAAQAAGATNTALGVPSDQSMPISSNARYLMPKRFQILGGLASCANLTAARVNAPSLRSILLPQLYPGNVGATVASPMEFADWGRNGPVVLPGEEVVVETSNNAGAGVISSAALFLGDGVDPIPAGPQYPMIATATPTLVAGAWVFSALTFDQVLPPGAYTVAGLRVVAPNGLAARLVYPGSTNLRPGCIIDNAYSGKQVRTPWTSGDWGNLGTFLNTAQPSIEVFGLVAGASAVTAVLDLVKTA